MIIFKKGDIFCGGHDILLCTTNCLGVYGKGIALSIKQKYPEIPPIYFQLCKEGKVKPGSIVGLYTKMINLS